MTKTCRIEKMTNLLGETRYRFVIPSILHPGQEQRSINNWQTRSGARAALIRTIAALSSQREAKQWR